MILNSPYISGSLTVTGNEVVTGSLTVLGGITGVITGSATSASYASNAELLDGLDSSVFVLSSSFQNYSSSNDGKVAALNTFSASILSYTSSTDDKIAQLNRETASLNLATASLYAATSSIYNFTSSANLRIGSLEQYTQSLNTRSASFACVTATNNFACTQYFSNASNAVSFTSTGSLYSDGGMRLTKDLYVSGTSYFNNVTIFGTQSVAYISSSQLNIGTNIISVNTDTPSIRFGGLAVYDSGSTGLTGSILWDSEANHWVYTNPSGSTYSGGMFISGPRASSLGTEQGTTSCMLLAGQGGDHLTSSMIYHDSTVTCIPNTLIGSTVCGSTSTFSSTSTACNFVTSGNTLFGITLKGRSSDNYGAIGFYSSDGGTRYGYLQSHSTNCGQLIVNGDGGGQAIFDCRGVVLTSALTGTTSCFSGNMTTAGCIGIGTNAAATPLHIATTGLPAIRLTLGSEARCHNINGVNLGRDLQVLPFRHFSVQAGNGITEGQIVLNAYEDFIVGTGASYTSRLNITPTGIACFACQICVKETVYVSGTFPSVTLDRGGTTAQSDVKWRDAGTTVWSIGTAVRAVGSSLDFYSYCTGDNVFKLTQTGITCFSNTVCIPSLIANTITLSTTTADYAATITNVQDSSQGLLIRSSDNDTNLNILNLQSSPGAACQTWIDRFTVTKGGNVGIGTNDPQSSLHIYSTNATTIIQNSSTSSVGNISRLFYRALLSSGDIGYIGFIDGVLNSTTDNTGYLKFHTYNNGNADERMRITSTGILGFNGNSAPGNASLDKLSIGYLNGGYGWIQTWNGTPLVLNKEGNNVGVGISSPQATLDVLSTLNIQATGNSDLPYINFSNNGRSFDWGRVGGLLQGNGDGSLYFQTKTGGGLTTKLTICSTGAATFSSSVVATQFTSNGGRGTDYGYKLPDWQIYNTSSGNNLAFSNYTVDFLTITSGGNYQLRNTVYSTSADVTTTTYRQLYPSGYNIAEIAVRTDGEFYTGAFSFRTADADNANVLVERMRIDSRGITCFRNTVCSPRFVGPLTGKVTGIAQRAQTSCVTSTASSDITIYFTSGIVIEYGVNDYTVVAAPNDNAAAMSSVRALIPYNYYAGSLPTTNLASYIDGANGHSSLSIAICKVVNSNNYCIAVRFAKSAGNADNTSIQVTTNGMNPGIS